MTSRILVKYYHEWYAISMPNVAPKQDLPHYRTLRVMHGSKYLTLPSAWDLDAYDEYLVQREPTGRITLDPMQPSHPGDTPSAQEASP
jgi:hypothetical protein